MSDLPTLPAGLHYVDDSAPGITRRKLRGKFAYFDTQGERIRDADTVARINALAVPPAYTNVWICPDPNGHLQATGRDARGRKQYRYHPRWREIRDTDKYGSLLAFGKALPALRATLKQHLAQPLHNREKVLATVILLLDNTLIRIGNARYAEENRSYGLTTLRNRHVDVSGSTIRFHFRGKSGIEHEVSVNDRRLARIIKSCLELPGQQLFQYLDEDGERHSVTSTDINRFLQELTGAEFTAKHYRTWAGSALALTLLRELEWQPETTAKKHVVAIIKEVAAELRNTPAVCRKCYVHPALIEAFHAGELAGLRMAAARRGLRAEESLLMRFLEKLSASAP